MNQKWALLSVSDKTGLESFAKGLVARGYQLLATGGTAECLKRQGIAYTEVADYTKQPEILGGRVKTLHPLIHAGILYKRGKDESDLQSINAYPISLVCVNLYPFEDSTKDPNMDLDEVIEFIDIGGPSMLRGAAKNYRSVYAVIDPADYGEVLKAAEKADHDLELARKLAVKVFAHTARYDLLIADRLAVDKDQDSLFKDQVVLKLSKLRDLRYGENPDQAAALYSYDNPAVGFADIKTKEGKELSYNNFLDANAAWELVSCFSPAPAACVVKHGNPCAAGAHLGGEATEHGYTVCQKALSGDPKSAFGGIFAANFEVDHKVAELLKPLFLELVMAPSFSEEAMEILSTKGQVRLLSLAVFEKTPNPPLEWTQIKGAFLAQEKMLPPRALSAEHGKWVSGIRSKNLEKDLHFAQTIAARVKSNAIVLAKEQMCIGIGAGQMSRVDAMELAIKKARELGHETKGAVCASDAFFPFNDCVKLAGDAGISAIIQPGGSKRDQESVDLADKLGIAMVFTGERRFRH